MLYVSWDTKINFSNFKLINVKASNDCMWYQNLAILREYKKIVAQSELKVKREYLVIIRDNFCQFYSKTYVVNRLIEMVQMRGHNIWFQWEIRKIIPQLSSNTPLV